MIKKHFCLVSLSESVKGSYLFSLSKYKEIENIKLLNMLLIQEDSFPLHTSNYLSIQYTYMKDLTE